MKDYWFPDNTVLCNFAVIDQLALLESFLSGRGRVVEAVANEIRQSAARVVHLANLDVKRWFGEPIRILDPHDIQAIEVTRVAVFGGTKREPLKHLGESQTIHILRFTREYNGSIWITDDRDAYKYAKDRGIQARRTVDVFATLVANSEISAETAFEHCVGIEAAGRTLLGPPRSARDFE